METQPQRPEERNEAGREKTSRWDNKLEFFMAAISFSLGLGNIWRFPYLAYRNGGGAFLIPYLLAFIIIGFPFITMDLALGQYGRRGPFGVWNLCPIFQGIGWSMCIVSFLVNTYFVMLMAYSIFYMFVSFSSTLPWTTCDNEWNTNMCQDRAGMCERSGGSWLNESCIPIFNADTPVLDKAVYPSEEYFNHQVLGISDGLDDLGGVQWLLALCLLLAWILIVVGLSLGTKSWGKLSYVTALLPYGVMLLLLIPACMKTGAGQGILYFIIPSFDRLANPQVWADAAVQVFFSLGCGTGSFITISKYNHFKNNPIIAAGVVVLVDFFTSIFCGFVVFAILGQMAAQMGVHIDDVAASGSGLAFVVYPIAVMGLPVPQLWSVLFFLMLLNLGLGSVIPQLANILDSLTEEIKILSSKLNRFITLICLAIISFLLGLVYTTNGGIYVLTLMDYYVPLVALIVIGLLEVLVVSWIYGSGRLLRDISAMTGWRPNYLQVFAVFWRAVCPIAIIAVIVGVSLNWFSPQYGGYIFPIGANFVGWLVTFCELLPIPVVIIYKLCMVTNRKELWSLVRPTADWGPEATQSQNPDMNYPTTEAPITSKV